MDNKDNNVVCLHPLYRVIKHNECKVVNRLPEQLILVRRDKSEHVKSKLVNGNIYTWFEKYDHIYVDDILNPSVYAMPIPCGKCYLCLNRLVNRWSMRIKHDIETDLCRAFFFTLTYRPEDRCTHIIKNVDTRTGEVVCRPCKPYELLSKMPRVQDQIKKLVDPISGEIRYYLQKGAIVYNTSRFTGTDIVDNYDPLTDSCTHRFEFDKRDTFEEIEEYENEHGFLYYPDVQNFIKRLRRVLDYYYGIKNVKFFVCGEYSPAPHILPNGHMTEGFLPHYHVLMWFKDTDKSNRGYVWYDSKTKKRVVSKFNTDITNFTLRLANGVRVFPLIEDLVRSLTFQCWQHAEEKSFNFSSVRSVEGCSRYISKYMLKAVIKENKYSEHQDQFPFKRWFSKGIGKNFVMTYKLGLQDHNSFKFEKDGFDFFYPSIYMKWSFSEFNEDGKVVTRWYENPNYFDMYRTREEYCHLLPPMKHKDIMNTCKKVALMYFGMSDR